MLDDVTGPQQLNLHMYPIILTSSCRRYNTLSIKGNENARGGSVPTTPVLYHGGGMSLHVRPRVKISSICQLSVKFRAIRSVVS